MFEMFSDINSEFYQAKKVLLIDGSFVMFRTFYGYSMEKYMIDETTSNNCVFGVAKFIIKILGHIKPDIVVFAYDISRSGHRLDLLPQYKDGRPPTPEQLIAQREPVRELIKLLGIPILELERYEADDIIATLAHQANNKSYKTSIFSSDRDMYQLICENTTVLSTNQYGGFKVLDTSYVFDKYGVYPDQYPELAALVGENADNIPGVHGIGPVTGAKLLREYGNLEKLLNNANKVGGKIGVSLCKSIEQVRLNRKVNELLRDAPLEYAIDDLRCKNPRLDEVDEFLRSWKIPSLVGKFDKVVKNMV
ncbi:MAG: hypothetical protein LBI63_01050 [Candidatus Ancillula sp.]|jgi:DNA polymerase-1|nr:hypothetical protein [Candidatus Ancillula sp.]